MTVAELAIQISAQGAEQAATGLRLVSDTADAAAASFGTLDASLDAVAAGMTAAGAAALDEVAMGMTAAGASAEVAAVGMEAAGAAAVETGSELNFLDGTLSRLAERMIALGLAFSVVEFFKHAISDTADLQDAQQRLQLAVQNTGATWTAVAPLMASAINQATTTTATSTTAATTALQQLVLFSGNAATAAANLGFAIDIAAAANVDLDSATRALGAGLGGNEALLTRMFRLHKGTADVLEVVRERTVGYAAAHAQTLGGAMQKVAVQFEEMLVQLGEAITGTGTWQDAVKVLSTGISDATNWIRQHAESINTLVQRWMAAIHAGQQLGAFIVGEFHNALTQVGRAADLAGAGIFRMGSLALGAFASLGTAVVDVFTIIDKIQGAVGIHLMDGVLASVTAVTNKLALESHELRQKSEADWKDFQASFSDAHLGTATATPNATLGPAGVGNAANQADAQLKAMKEQLSLGQELIANDETRQAGERALTAVEASAEAVIARKGSTVKQLAEAYKILGEAQTAMLKPGEQDLALGKELIQNDATRADGMMAINRAISAATNAIATSADNPKMLALAYKDLHDAEQALLGVAQSDLALGRELIANEATRAQGVRTLMQAEAEANRVVHDANASAAQRGAALKTVHDAELAFLVPMQQEVAVAKELVASDATRARGLDQLATAMREAAAIEADMTKGADVRAGAAKVAADAERQYIQALQAEVSLGTELQADRSTQAAGDAMVADAQARLKAAIESGTLSLRDQVTAIRTLHAAMAQMGDFSGVIADKMGKAAQTAKQQVAEDFANLGRSAITSIADGLAAGIAAAFTGKDPLKAMGSAILSSLGNIFAQMGTHMITAGIAMMGLQAAIMDPFTSGPAMIAAGIVLTGLGKALGSIMSGGTGGGSASASSTLPGTTTNISVTNSAAMSGAGVANPGAPFVFAPTIIGPSDRAAQRQIMQLVNNALNNGHRFAGA